MTKPDLESGFRNLVEAAPDGIAVTRGGVVEYVNLSGARLLGAAHPGEVVGTSLIERMDPRDQETMRERVAAAVRSGRAPEGLAEYRVPRPDGGTAVVEVRSIPVEFRGGPAVLGVARDVTLRRQSQDQLMKTERLAAIGRLAAGVAHEINNPLAYMTLNLGLLARMLPELARQRGGTEEALERLAEIEQGTRRVAEIVSDLLSFAQGGDGALGPVDIDDVLARALRTVGSKLVHLARVERRQGAPTLVLGNAPQLQQVFTCLLDNAADAVRDVADASVRIEVRAHDAQVEVDLIDNGVGIPAEHLDLVFEPFFTTKGPDAGTGLGLGVSRGLVSGMGGTIDVRSQPGATIFTVRLERWRERPGSQDPPPSGRPHRARVLVVDDDPLVGASVARLLRPDYDVTVAGGGEHALESILGEAAGFDAIISDILMPRIDGIELHDRVHKIDPALAGRMIFITGDPTGPRVRAFLKAPGRRYLLKPFSTDDVLRELREVTELVIG